MDWLYFFMRALGEFRLGGCGMAGENPKRRPPAPYLAFSTDDLPDHMDDEEKRRLFQGFRDEVFGKFDDTFADDRPLRAYCALAAYGAGGAVRAGGTLVRTANSAPDIAEEGRSNFFLGVNLSDFPMIQRQLGREQQLAPRELGFLSAAHVGEILSGPVSDYWSVAVPGDALRELVVNVDDLVARRIDPDLPAARYFRRYVRLILDPDGIEDDPLLTEHVATTLLDLAALCLGAGREAAEMAEMRGMRAARLQLVLGEIRESFADPGFSTEVVAKKLGLSPRRVQGLLQETGRSFTERVLEMRLQHARAMLASRRHDALKVSEIAYASGFSDISYFNRRFRARFGCAPTEYRKEGVGSDSN